MSTEFIGLIFKRAINLTRVSFYFVFNHCYVNLQPCHEAKVMPNLPPTPKTGPMDLYQFFWQLGSLWPPRFDITHMKNYDAKRTLHFTWKCFIFTKKFIITKINQIMLQRNKKKVYVWFESGFNLKNGNRKKSEETIATWNRCRIDWP